MNKKHNYIKIITILSLITGNLFGDETDNNMIKINAEPDRSAQTTEVIDCDDKYLIDNNSREVKLVLVFAQLAYYLPKSLDDITEMHDVVGTTKNKEDFRKDMMMMMQSCKAEADEINSALEKKAGTKVQSKWSEHSMTLEEAKKHFLELFPAYLECKRKMKK